MQVDETGSGPLNFDKFRCVATNATAASHSKVIQHLGQVLSQGQQSHLLGCMVIRFGAQADIMLIMRCSELAKSIKREHKENDGAQAKGRKSIPAVAQLDWACRKKSMETHVQMWSLWLPAAEV